MKRLLVVDDDQDILEATKLMLVTSGYEVETAGSAEEAFQKTLAIKPDLVVLDFLLSGKDGAMVCARIKNAASVSDTPIIIFSAHPSAKNWAKECGADSFIAKPFAVNELLAEIQKYIGLAN